MGEPLVREQQRPVDLRPSLGRAADRLERQAAGRGQQARVIRADDEPGVDRLERALEPRAPLLLVDRAEAPRRPPGIDRAEEREAVARGSRLRPRFPGTGLRVAQGVELAETVLETRLVEQGAEPVGSEGEPAQ